MTYVFQEGFDLRLKSWYDLRQTLQASDLQTKCVEIDKWWQRVPLVNRYLDDDSIDTWPTPWELLSDNHYCETARGLGMVYTLLLLGINEVEFVQAVDYNKNSVALVLVDHAKYIMNYWPDSVVNSSLHSFTITNTIDVKKIQNKIGL
jgi:hypothetical protein